MAALGSKYFTNSRAAYFQLPGSVGDPKEAKATGDDSTPSLGSETPRTVVETKAEANEEGVDKGEDVATKSLTSS